LSPSGSSLKFNILVDLPLAPVNTADNNDDAGTRDSNEMTQKEKATKGTIWATLRAVM
jgi:hypothetical protein